MYLNFYQMTKKPFHVTPDPDFFFLSESHKQALAAIVYGVKTKKGFITITGPVGSGKTTILRTFMQNADPGLYKLIYLFDPVVSFSTLVTNLCREFNLSPPGGDPAISVEMLHLALVNHYRHGRTVVLIIDEAQNMPAGTLESVRMLSNLETTKDKLLQIVLSGQPELEEVLRQRSLYQLKQRRAVRTTITPLSRRESVAYIASRLSKAGASDTSIFTKAALRMVTKEAKGIPRTINIICDNALATAYGYKKKRVDAGIMREVFKDLQEPRPFSRKIGAAAAIGLVIVACLFAIFRLDLLSYVSFADDPRTRIVRVEATQAQQNWEEDTNTRIDGNRKSMPPTVVSELRTTRIVKKGDTVSKFVKDIYQASQAREVDGLIAEILRSNPHIKDASFIYEGQEILFPEVKHDRLEVSR